VSEPSKKTPAPIALAAVAPLCVAIPQAAAMLGCSVRAVRELLWAKKIPHLRLGIRFVIPVAEIEKFVRRTAA
jgi:excisionase family DNA binding protein